MADYATWSNLSTTQAWSLNIDEMVATVQRFREEGDAINRRFAIALGDYFNQSTLSLSGGAERLQVPLPYLLDVLALQKPPSGQFWEQCRRVFNEIAGRDFRPTHGFVAGGF